MLSGLAFALVTFKVDKVDQEGETKQAGFAFSAGALGEDHGKGVGCGATLLHQTSPNFANLRCVGIIVLASDDFILLIMEVECRPSPCHCSNHMQRSNRRNKFPASPCKPAVHSHGR